MNKILQEVGGRRIEGSLSDFEHKAKVYLTIESEKINCDTGLISILCEAVRLSREYEDFRRASIHQ